MNLSSSRYAIITGAAGGIERALVQEFHNNGYSGIATDMMDRPADLPCAHYVQADLGQTVSDAEYANRILAEMKNVIGKNGLRALVNNAAIQILGGVDTLTRNDWQATLNVNLLAPFFWTQNLLPELEAAKGSVVNISSIHARLTKKNFVAYATSKAALSGMTRAMVVDIGGRVRFNAIEPAAIETAMLKAGFAGKPELYQQLQACHPLGRIGKPDEVAHLALLMVRDDLGFLQGACVGLDGGIAGSLLDPI